MTSFGDFHIHIGSSQGKPVKVAASKLMTVDAVVAHARSQKGLDVITLVDAVCDGPYEELVAMVERGDLQPLAGGGLLHENGLVILTGVEIETAGPHGAAAHFGCWLPTLASVSEFRAWLKTVQTNTSLSSQRVRATAMELQRRVKDVDGVFIVHHAFTPHKGLYGCCVLHMDEMLDPAFVDAVELGLSSDSAMADRIEELAPFTFLSNSDAHSVRKIAREYNRLQLDTVDFHTIHSAIQRTGVGGITGNFGLDPRLGKYHRTACAICGTVPAEPADVCTCGSSRWVRGVSGRIDQIADFSEPIHPPHRPPYVHQIPLEFVPGLGPGTLRRLFDAFGTEMYILHSATLTELIDVVGERLALSIDQARTGTLSIQAGAGGVYGKVRAEVVSP